MANVGPIRGVPNQRGAAGPGSRNGGSGNDGGNGDVPTREEMDAKLAAVEAKVGAQITEISAKIDTLSSEMRSWVRISGGESLNIRSELARISTAQVNDTDRLLRQIEQTERLVRGVNWKIWTASGTVILAFVAILSFAWQVFDSGRDTATVAREAALQVIEPTIQKTATAAAAAAVNAAAISTPPAPRQSEPNNSAPQPPP